MKTRLFFALIATLLLAPSPALAAGFAPVPRGAIQQQQQQAKDFAATTPPSFAYSALLSAIRKHQIKLAKVDESTQTVEVLLKNGAEREAIYPLEDQTLTSRLAASGAKVVIVPLPTASHSGGGSALLNLLGLLLLPLALIAVIVWAQKRQSGGAGGFGPANFMRLRKSTQVQQVPNVRFSDVAGVDEAVEELREVVLFLKNPKRFARLGAKMPRGALLYGPPGTGKTLMAKALAGEAGLPFFQVSGSDFVEKFVGVGASRVRELFEQARKQDKGAIIFFDELDAVGRRRSGAEHGGNDERDQTLNQLLVELDGFTESERIFVVGATNRLDVLDPALIRPGRLSRQIQVAEPSEDGRLEILQVHAKGKPLDSSVDLGQLARMTNGLSGAQLAEIVNEAAIMAARDERTQIGHADLMEGWLRVLAGPEKAGGQLNEDERVAIAYHEAGHVLTAELCETQDKAERVTIRRRGQALGLAAYQSTDRALHDMQTLHEWMVCLLGGRAAEQLLHGRPSSGAANDLMKVNGIARRAVEEFGLSPRVGQIISGSDQGARHNISEKTREIIDQEVEQMVADAYRNALIILEANRDTLDRLAKMLLEREDLDRIDILQAVEGEMIHGERVIPAMGPRNTAVLAPSGEAGTNNEASADFRYRYRPRQGLLERLFGEKRTALFRRS